MAIEYPHTLLPLHTFAKILGLPPMHFAGGATPGINPEVMPASGCDDIWHKYDWQDNDKVSLMQIAQTIHDAEMEIARFIGYWPAPYWTEEELHQYPRPWARDAYSGGRDVRDRLKTIFADYGKIIGGGTRALTLIGTATTVGATLAYTDPDGDGYYELATIVLPTTATNAQQIKVYHAGYSGALEWEIRPVISKTISGGFVTITAYSWLFIEPDLYEEFPTSNNPNNLYIDVTNTSNFVTSVEVYQEYLDTTATSATFYWATDIPVSMAAACPNCGTVGCVACSYDTQDGCIVPRNHAAGELIAFPATYNQTAAIWGSDTWLSCLEPDIVKISYLSGDQSQEFLQFRDYEPMKMFFAQLITWLAVARLDRPLCTCGNLSDKVLYLQQDTAIQSREMTSWITPDAMDSPFGTRRGEVMAWRRLKRSAKDRRFAVAVV